MSAPKPFAPTEIQRRLRRLQAAQRQQRLDALLVTDEINRFYFTGLTTSNGMLLSEHIRLVAAFDHRHIFVDPNPVAATSFAERRRLFELPRSSWADYDTAAISEGGGVFERQR